MFDIGLIKTVSPEQFTVSVGNLSVGGSGKTPFVKYLVQNLPKDKIAVLSRGYGRKTKGYLQVSTNSKTLDVGDEPKMIAEMGVATFVNENRVEGAALIYQNHPNKTILLLDDAYQHRYIKANLSILISPFENLFSQDFLLPAGNLREARKGVNRADVLIISKTPEHGTLEELNELRTKLSSLLQPNVPIFFCEYVNTKPINEAKSYLEKKDSIDIVSGLADNHSFQNSANKDYSVNQVFAFPDHHNYVSNDILRIFESSQGRKVLTTAKDYIKLKDICSQDQRSRLYYTDTLVRFVDEEEKFKAILFNAFEAYS